MTHSVIIGALLAGSYLLGSLPFGLWIVKKWKGIDIREHGSGNIGATNVGRICGPAAWIVVFTLDVLKGLLPPLVGAALHLASPWPILAALLAIIGHNYSIWLGFKGGKGIATSLGALLGIAPQVALIAIALFGVEIVIPALGYVSLGSLIGALALPILMPLFYPGDYYRLGFGILACAMAFYRHRANIQRLRKGTEPKIHLWGRKKKTSADSTPEPPTAVVRREREQNAPATSLQKSMRDEG